MCSFLNSTLFQHSERDGRFGITIPSLFGTFDYRRIAIVSFFFSSAAGCAAAAGSFVMTPNRALLHALRLPSLWFLLKSAGVFDVVATILEGNKCSSLVMESARRSCTTKAEF